MTLVSERQLSALRKVAELGMQTMVDIYPRVEIETPSDTAEGWPTKSVTVKGWIRSMPAATYNIDVGSLEASTPFRIFLPVGTEVHSGDRLLIGGDFFSVVDTNIESTIRVVLRCTARKVGT
jgi:hypothetical protein